VQSVGDHVHYAEYNSADEEPNCHGSRAALVGAVDGMIDCVAIMSSGYVKLCLDAVSQFYNSFAHECGNRFRNSIGSKCQHKSRYGSMWSKHTVASFSIIAREMSVRSARSWVSSFCSTMSLADPPGCPPACASPNRP
jgi:hypothetical protein